MTEPVAFNPITAPGGYIVLVYTFPATPRRTIQPLTNGSATASHLGWMQKKTVLIKWHSVNLDIGTNFIIPQEVNGFVIDGEPSSSPVVNDTLNLFNTEITFIRYLPYYDPSQHTGSQISSRG